MDNIRKNMLQTHGINWIEDKKEQQLEETGVKPELRDMLDSTVTLLAEKALQIDATVRSVVHHKSYPMNQLQEECTETFIDRLCTHSEKLRTVATKIKMRRNRDIAKNITKNRILRNNMVDVGCEEIVQGEKEEQTVQ